VLENLIIVCWYADEAIQHLTLSVLPSNIPIFPLVKAA